MNHPQTNTLRQAARTAITGAAANNNILETKSVTRLHRVFAPAFTLAASAAVLAALPFAGLADAQAQAYPNKPIRWVVGYPPGGTTDILARIMAQRISEKIGSS